MSRAEADSFLLLMADQLAASWLPWHGHSVVKAPALTELATQSAVFESAYCPYPLCAPSRAAVLTGRYASRVGVYDNAAELAAGVPTLAHALRAAGYDTALAGKMHFVGPDQLHGFEERLTTDIYPADVDWTPDWSRPLGQPLPWYHTMESVLNPGVCTASMQTDYDDEVAFHAVRKLRALARRRVHEPFALCVSFTNPHDPWELPRRCWDRYRPEEIDDPAVPALPREAADPHSRRLRDMYRVDAAGLTTEQIRRARHGYYAAVAYLDEKVGQVLTALRETGLDQRTTVLFCADHGEMLGERGLWYKMAFFEPSARVPLLVRRPGSTPRRVAEPVSLLDVAPTLLELAGVSDHGLELDGVSLAAAVAGTGVLRRGPVISEYHAEGVQAPSAMVRCGRHKLIVSGQDPVVAQLRAELDARLDLEDIRRRVLVSQRERALVSRALRRGRYTSWDYQPPGEAAVSYIRNREDLYELQRRARLDDPGGGP
jgi:choline-sulfatase